MNQPNIPYGAGMKFVANNNKLFPKRDAKSFYNFSQDDKQEWLIEEITSHVGCIYAHYKVNPNIFQFYFDFMDIFHHPPMHPLFCNIYEFYLFSTILFHLLLSTIITST